jgi:imidazolonepropionase-like amidohydrolase
MYKVGAEIAKDGTGIATFADWWGFKDEAWDAIPWNAVMSMREGVTVALKSDSNDHVRRLNQEAGKMVHYGGATEDEALRMITLNAAWIMGVEDKTGSLDIGKDGDVVIWNMDPLSTYARTEKVFIDGDLYFDSSLPGYGLTHFTGVMHGGGFGGSDDDAEDNGGGN